MAFELVQKRFGITAQHPDSVSVTKSGFSIGSNLTEALKGFAFVEIYFDVEEKKVGLKGTNDNTKGFRINSTGKSWVVSSSTVARITTGRYEAGIKDGIIIFAVPEIEQKKHGE